MAGETVLARYVVGGDGAHSTVRAQAGIGLADLETDDLNPDAVHTWFTDTGMRNAGFMIHKKEILEGVRRRGNRS